MNTKCAFAAEPGQKNRTDCIASKSRKSNHIPELVIIVFIILKNPFIACTDINSSFYNKVLNDFDTSSYYIAVDIKSPVYKGRTIIENNNLYLFLQKTKGLDKGKYLNFMKRTLRHHRSLKITGMDIVIWKFIKVQEVESIINAANGGRDRFVAKYFNGTVLNFGISIPEQNAIINQLFYWGIPAKTDKLTGELIIG